MTDEVPEIVPFDPTKKKKKKKVVIQDPVDDSVDKLTEKTEILPGHNGNGRDGGGERSDRDYEYEMLLGRVFNILRENNPELAGCRRRMVLRPPQVLREGTKKTIFVNFMELCNMMHRRSDHVMDFFLDELGTNGSIDGQQRLVVKGRFAPKNFEAILRTYHNDYVICLGCKGSDTILSKENRLLFLRCEQCGSERSVAQIKAGPLVGRRRNTRI